VLPPDPYQLDGTDNDGVGCEDNPGSAAQATTTSATGDPLPVTGGSIVLLSAVALGALALGLMAKRQGDRGMVYQRVASRWDTQPTAEQRRHQRVQAASWSESDAGSPTP
jgi:hypothetical protein